MATFRIFVGFGPGLAEERDVLHREVFPKLRALCQHNGCGLQAIDSPARKEEGLDPGDLSVRLGEIARCQCYFYLLGGREDWRPLPAAIPASEFLEIEKRVPGGSTAFLREWYPLDTNAVPPVHVLRPRTGVFAQPAIRERYVERPLAGLLVDAIRGLDLPPAARLKYEAPAIEQEILAAGHTICFSRAGEGTEPEAAALRRRLRELLAGDYAEYRTNDVKAFAASALAALSRFLKAEIARLQKTGPAGREAMAHAAFARERARHFTGREKPLERIAEYLKGSDPHPLVIAGPPGSGKSALLALAAERHGESAVLRSIGVTAESSDGRALLEGICRRLGPDALESAGYDVLIGQLAVRLKAAAPITLIVDALDYLPPLDQARDLDWLPTILPEGVRLVVSTAPGDLLFKLRRMVPVENIVELEPMTLAEAGRLLDLWLGAAGRTLTEPQRARVIEAFRSCGLPLYARLVFEEARLWHSYDPLDACTLGSDTSDQIHRSLGRLTAACGAPLVSRCLGYLAASRLGLAEDELLDVLSHDGESAADWPRLYRDLRPCLAERHDGGATLLSFACRQLAAEVERRFLAGEEGRARHQALARYFGERSVPARRLSELVWQQAHGGLWADLQSTLTSLEFIEAKSRAGLVRDLAADYRIANRCWGSEKKEPPPWNEWAQFVLEQAHAIEAWVAEFPHIVFQQAFNESRRGGVAQAALSLLQEARGPQRPWLERVNRPDLPAPRACLFTLEGHRGPVSSAVLAGGGSYVVSGGQDGLVRLWSLTTGACVRTMPGHGGAVTAVAAIGDDLVASASLDGTVNVWNLYSGERLHVLQGHGCPVVALAEVEPHCVVSGAEDGSLRLWGATGGDCLAVFTGHQQRINFILPLQGGRIASASDDGSVRVWRHDGSPAGVLTGHSGPVLHLSWVPGALSTSAASGKVFLWDLEAGRPRDILTGHTGPVAGTALLDPTRMVSWSYDHTIRIWSLVDGSQLTALHYHDAPVTHLRVLEDGRMLSASQDFSLRLWASSGEPLGVLRGHRAAINALAAAGPSLAISAGSDQTLRVWNLDAAAEHPAVELPSDILRSQDIESVSVLDGKTAVSVTRGPDALQLWDLEGGRCIQSAVRDSAVGQRLWDRLHATGTPGPPGGLSIAGITRRADEPDQGLALTRVTEREGGLLDRESRPLATYPLVCRPHSQSAGYDCAIAFDARTREPHIVRAHSEPIAEESAAALSTPPAGALRSLFRKLLGR